MTGNKVEVKILTSVNRAKWDAYIELKDDATFFHLSGWMEVLARGLGHKPYFLYAEQDGKIVGVLPLAHVQSLLFGNSLVSTPFCVYGGVVSDSVIVSDLLERYACELAAKLSVDYLEIRNQQPVEGDWETKDLYVTFKKEISTEPEVNMLSIPRKQRAVVRKAINLELKSEIDHDLDRFYQAYSESVRNLGTPVFSKKYFRVLKEVFESQCGILTITKDGKLVASVLSFYFRDEVLPYYGGGVAAARVLKGNDFMYWELMRRSGEQGVRLFDFGRSKKGAGSYSFKKNWGFDPVPLHYRYHLVKTTSVPDINPMNPKYQLFIKIWRKLPLEVANFIGPYIARNLG